jgi:hypothetical protein
LLSNADELLEFMQHNFKNGDPCHVSKRKQLKNIRKKLKHATRDASRKSTAALMQIAKDILMKQEKI